MRYQQPISLKQTNLFAESTIKTTLRIPPNLEFHDPGHPIECSHVTIVHILHISIFYVVLLLTIANIIHASLTIFSSVGSS